MPWRLGGTLVFRKGSPQTLLPKTFNNLLTHNHQLIVSGHCFVYFLGVGGAGYGKKHCAIPEGYERRCV